MPLVRRQKVDWQDDVFMQISESRCGRAIRHGRWKYSVRHAKDEDARSPAATEYREECLYDLYADPYELDNRVGIEPLAEVSAMLRERLTRRIKDAEGLDVVIRPAEPRAAGQRYRSNLRPLDQWRM